MHLHSLISFREFYLWVATIILTLSTLDKDFSRWHFDIFSPDNGFDISCLYRLQWRQFAREMSNPFCWKNMKLIINSILVYHFVISWIISDSESGNMVKLYTKIKFVIHNIIHTNKQQLSHKKQTVSGFALGFFFLSPPFSPIWFFLCHFL